MKKDGLGTVYTLGSAQAARAFYDDWAEGYEEELAENGYVTPLRCATALAEHATDPSAPILEIGCGTGLGGLALRAAGFETIDGFDLSPEMLKRAGEKDIYRDLGLVDLSEPLEQLHPGTYANAAAIGVFNPSFMAPTVIDEVLAKLPQGGCFVFSLNDHATADGSFETRILELTEYNVADLVFKEYGEHLPEQHLRSTVYVLKKR